MRTVKSIFELAEMSEQKRWRLNRYLGLIENHGVELPQIADTQSNSLGIATAHTDLAIKKIYGQSGDYRALMQQLHTEQKAAFPRVTK